MSNSPLIEQVETVIAGIVWPTPTAAKRGRNASFPWVPIRKYSDAGLHQTSQIKGKAFATRDEAVEFASLMVEREKESLRMKLLKPQHRALRLQHGLQAEVPR